MILVKGYQIKVTLRHTKPKIWRRLQVPSNLTFKELSAILYTAMDWEGYHLSGFRIGKGRNYIAIEEEADEEFDILDMKKEKINKYFSKEEKITYLYDYGDNWEHDIVVEEVLGEYKNKYAQVIKYKGDCPPEDCGGIAGYYDFMDRDDEEAQALKDEIIEYNMSDTNERLKNIKEIIKYFEEMFEDE